MARPVKKQPNQTDIRLIFQDSMERSMSADVRKNETRVQSNNLVTLPDGKTWHEDENAVFRCRA